MSYRISGLAAEPFHPLFALSDAELAGRRAVRVIADRPQAYPCRISLTDAEPGQTLILLNYEHHAVNTPFQSSHAIYVREGEQCYDEADQVPDMLRRRLLSVRGFDAAGMLVDADIIDGNMLEDGIQRLFAQPAIDYLHLHFARPGCYAARVDRQ